MGYLVRCLIAVIVPSIGAAEWSVFLSKIGAGNISQASEWIFYNGDA